MSWRCPAAVRVSAVRAKQSGRTGSCAAFCLSWVDRSPAIMQKLSARLIECKPVSAVRRWLIMASTDRQSREVAIEQSAGPAVTDDGNVVISRIGSNPVRRAGLVLTLDDALPGTGENSSWLGPSAFEKRFHSISNQGPRRSPWITGFEPRGALFRCLPGALFL